MTSLSEALPKNASKRGMIAAKRRTAAYRALFTGNPTREDATIVLADMGTFCKMFEAMAPGTSNDVLRVIEGRRSVMAMILHYLSLSPEELLALDRAAGVEAAANDAELVVQ